MSWLHQDHCYGIHTSHQCDICERLRSWQWQNGCRAALNRRPKVTMGRTYWRVMPFTLHNQRPACWDVTINEKLLHLTASQNKPNGYLSLIGWIEYFSLSHQESNRINWWLFPSYDTHFPHFTHNWKHVVHECGMLWNTTVRLIIHFMADF